MSKAGYLDDTTYVFITGDHGQQFFEHGGFGHGMYLYQELCNIPLLIYNRGLEGKEDRRLASGLDIAPTILDLAGVACPPQFCGQSILNSTYTDKDIILQEGRNENKDFIIDRNRVYLDVSKYKIALVSKPYKFIMNSHAAHELYNLEKDPQELNNLAQIDIAVCDELRKRVESHLREVHGSDLRRSMRKKVQLLKSRGRI